MMNTDGGGRAHLHVVESDVYGGTGATLRIRQVHPYVRTALTALLVSAGYYLGGIVGIWLTFPASPSPSSGRPTPSCWRRCCSRRCERGGCICSQSCPLITSGHEFPTRCAADDDAWSDLRQHHSGSHRRTRRTPFRRRAAPVRHSSEPDRVHRPCGDRGSLCHLGPGRLPVSSSPVGSVISGSHGGCGFSRMCSRPSRSPH